VAAIREEQDERVAQAEAQVREQEASLDPSGDPRFREAVAQIVTLVATGGTP
jgi:hypothetical protein